MPTGDALDPQLSIVIPALDEELTIADFVEWCHLGLRDAGVVGEILIVDSSTDKTAEIALAKGARVLKTPRRGLGRAYIDAIPYVRGRWVLMGDADCTYDFRELRPFVEAFENGYEFVMGSRWKGSIEPGSMPFLHRYLGTPITTRILNLVYSSRFSDIHCGMRGITRDSFARMNLKSQSWEYASEMVLKSIHMKLRTCEVPVKFLKDREGRLSHHRRSGWFSPFQAAWINLKAMFIYGADFFALKPGLLLLFIGALITLPLSAGPIAVGNIDFSLYWMLFGVSLTVLGLQSFFLGCIAQLLYDRCGEARRRWLSIFPYTRTVTIAAAMFSAGIALAFVLLVHYVKADFVLRSGETINHLGVLGLLLIIAGFMTFTFTLLLHAAALRVEGSPSGSSDESKPDAPVTG